jgi:hypothetical protein
MRAGQGGREMVLIEKIRDAANQNQIQKFHFICTNNVIVTKLENRHRQRCKQTKDVAVLEKRRTTHKSKKSLLCSNFTTF